MNHGSLFSGIGGFDLGFQWAGIETIWQVEIEKHARAVLAKHFPHAKRYENILECGSRNLDPVDIISGGFPCQDISTAGKQAGIDGDRSGLWREYARIIRELRPRYVVVENVAALLNRGIERVLGDLAACGYDAEWQCIRAADVGAPHKRDRVWIIAYDVADSDSAGPSSERYRLSGRQNNATGAPSRAMADADGGRFAMQRESSRSDRLAACGGETFSDAAHDGARRREQFEKGSEGTRNVADTDSGRREQRNARERLVPIFDARSFRDAESSRHERADTARDPRAARFNREYGSRRRPSDWWATEPDVGRVAHGISARVDRLRGLGNAIVPQIAQWIGEKIIEAQK